MLINWRILNNLRVTNDLMPINQLPPEVLSHICSINAHREHQPFTCKVWKNPVGEIEIPSQLRDTLNASYVCVRWRNILVTNPGLWSSFINLDPECEYADLARIILKRSKAHKITFIKPHSFLHFGLLAKCAPRITTFHFSGGMKDSGWNPTMVDLTFSSLRFLCLFRDDYEVTVSNLFPGSATPALEILHLHGFSVQSPSQLLSLHTTLTELRIENLSSEEKTCSTVKQWIDTLSQLPLLQHLVLFHAAAPSEGPMIDIDPHGLIHLPLIELKLKSFSSACIQIFSKLSVPSSCRILEIDRGAQLDDHEAGLLSSHLGRAITNMASSPRAFGECILQYSIPNQLQCTSESYPSDPCKDPSRKDAWVFVMFYCTRKHYSTVLHSFRPFYDRVRVLKPIDPPKGIQSRVAQPYFPFMELLPQLSNLRVIKSVSPQIMEAISSLIPLPENTEPSNVTSTFLNLEELHFDPRSAQETDDYGKYLEYIKYFFRYKTQSGYPLKVIKNRPKSSPPEEIPKGLELSSPYPYRSKLIQYTW